MQYIYYYIRDVSSKAKVTTIQHLSSLNTNDNNPDPNLNHSDISSHASLHSLQDDSYLNETFDSV